MNRMVCWKLLVFVSATITSSTILALTTASAKAFTFTRTDDLLILPYGDSNTQGFPQPESNGYREFLSEKLTKNEFNFEFVGQGGSGSLKHQGKGGITLREMAEEPGDIPSGNKGNRPSFINFGSVNNVTSFIAKNNEISLDDNLIVLLMAGTNDVSSIGTNPDTKDLDEDPQDAFDRLTRIVDQLLDEPTKIDAAFVSTIPPVNNANDKDDSIEYNSLIREEYLVNNPRKNVIFVDHDVTFLDGDMLKANLYRENDAEHPTAEGYEKMAQNWFEAIESAAVTPGSEFSFEATAGSITANGRILYTGSFGRFTDEGILNDNATWNIDFTGIDQNTQERFGFTLTSDGSQWEFDVEGGSGPSGSSFFEVTADELRFNASNFVNLVGTPSNAFGPIVGASTVDFSLFGPDSASGQVGFELFAVGGDVGTVREPFSDLIRTGSVDFRSVPEPGTLWSLVTIAGMTLGLKRKFKQTC